MTLIYGVKPQQIRSVSSVCVFSFIETTPHLNPVKLPPLLCFKRDTFLPPLTSFLFLSLHLSYSRFRVFSLYLVTVKFIDFRTSQKTGLRPHGSHQNFPSVLPGTNLLPLYLPVSILITMLFHDYYFPDSTRVF